MRVRQLAIGAAIASVIASGALAQDNSQLTPDSPDQYLWLSEIHGDKAVAWAKEQTAKSMAQLTADPMYKSDYDEMLTVLNANDRIPTGELDHGDVYNFWQDARHVRGLWRKTSAADYRNADPHWNVLLDVDKLDTDEHANWVFQGGRCAPGGKSCLVRLSPGGGDASAVREFDPNAKTFLRDGFTLSVAKSDTAWLDANTILFATDFGPGTLTKSSYPRIVKIWHRGEPIDAAKTIYEASETDISARALVLRGPYGTIPLIERGLTTFTAEYFYLKPDNTTLKLPLPVGTRLHGATNGDLIFTTRDAWTAPDGQQIPQGSLVAFPVQRFVKTNKAAYTILFTPDAHGTIEDVAAGRDAVYASIFENVMGAIHEFKRTKKGTWADKALDLPKGGTTHIVSADDWTPLAQFTVEGFLMPPTLFAYDGKGAPAKIKAEPARFDAGNMVSEQFWATSADGTQVPYFYIHQKSQKGPAPTILYSYGGFELSLEPWYWNDGHRPLDAGGTWIAKGGAMVVANIRGGGEFGPKWHEGSMKLNHQHAFDDFEAVAADIEKRGFASPKQVGIVGASNGGLLVTASMVERPDLFGAVVCQRPLVDMLRYTHFGAGASWVDEYGDPADPVMRVAILKYSAYENIKPDVRYPPILFITETSDDRVTPVFARMMAAKMEDMKQDVLFYESPEGGHGPGATHAEEAEYWAMSYTYFAEKLGLESTAGASTTNAPH